MAPTTNAAHHSGPRSFGPLSSAAFYRRYIARQSSLATWPLPHLLAYLFLFLFSLDFILLATGQRTLYLHHDPLLFYFRRHVTSHSVVFYFIPLFIALFANVDYVVALQDNRPLAAVAADLLLDNGAHFRVAMGNRSIRHFISLFRTYNRLWTGSLQIVFTRRLAYLPALTAQTRVRLALLQLEWLVPVVAICILVIFGLGIPLAVLAILLIEPTFRTTWQAAIFTSLYLIVELNVLGIVYLNTILLTVFAVHLSVLLCLLIFWHGGDINRQLRHYVTSRMTSQWRLAIVLAHYRTEHAKLLKVLLTTNRHLVSSLLFWLVLPNLAISIYEISLAYFTALNIFTQTYFLLLIFFQSFSFPLLKYLPKPVKMLYCNQSTLYRAQMALRGPSLVRDKIKLLYTYELVNCKAKYWFTFGTLSPISDMWVYETVLLYTSYLMSSFKMFY